MTSPAAYDVTEIAPLSASLLSLPDRRYVVSRLSPQQVKERLIDAQVEQVLGLAHAQPLLLSP